jgi:hypothetical protein
MERRTSTRVVAALVLVQAALGCEVRSRAVVAPIHTVVGDPSGEAEGPDVPALATYIGDVIDVAVGPDGNVYFVSSGDPLIRVWDRGADSVRIVAGNGALGNGPEGPALEAALGRPTALAFDPAGRLLVADGEGPGHRVERIDLVAGTIENVAGSGSPGFVDDVAASEARLDHPSGVAVDSSGNVFIADERNNRVRVLGDDELMHTYAGTGPGWCVSDGVTDSCGVCAGGGAVGWLDCYTGDGGPAVAATRNMAVGVKFAVVSGRISLDSGGNLFVADSGNAVVRRIERGTTTITTVAGVGRTPGVSGDGGPATEASLQFPADVAVFVADAFASCVRRIGTDGVIATVAGICGQDGYAGDDGPAVAALLASPWGIDLDARGDLYIADRGNSVIRWVNFP